MVDNQFFLNPSNYFRIERPDEHSLVVYDKEARIVLAVRYLNRLAVKLLGTFYYGGHAAVIDEEQLVLDSAVRRKTCFGNFDYALELD